MTFTETLLQIGVTTIGNLISNLAYIILFIWGIRFLGREISKGIQKVPEWIENYHKRQIERIRINEALDRRER